MAWWEYEKDRTVYRDNSGDFWGMLKIAGWIVLAVVSVGLLIAGLIWH